MPVLYDYPLSTECYRVRLLLALLGETATVVPVDAYPGGEHLGEAFRAINPFGTLPALVDGDVVLTDSGAILAYLARRFDPDGSWFPVNDPAAAARIVEWLAIAAKLDASAGVARAHDMLGADADIVAARATATELIRRIEQHLAETDGGTGGFLTGPEPTIADLACFSGVALAPDGGIELDFCPYILNWMHRIRRLEGFITMPGIQPLHESPVAHDIGGEAQSGSAA